MDDWCDFCNGDGCPECEYEHEDYADDDDGGDCYWCGGEGWDECPDPIQCTREHRYDGDWQFCRCASCGGSGAAKDMTIW